MTLRERIVDRLFGDIIAQRAQAAAVSVRVDDSAGWDAMLGAGPLDRPWSDLKTDLDDSLEAWRKNFLVRRIVTLTRSYVVGKGIAITSKDPEIDEFVQEFWDHQQNHMPDRLGPMCDELTRTGEIFPTLHTNRVDGMSYVRFRVASEMQAIITDPDDYEVELEYHQRQKTTAEPKVWIGPGHKNAFGRKSGGRGGAHLVPLMLHYTVNKPLGATRGESDLLPILPWAKRYSGWLNDRVRLNRRRTRQGLMDITLDDDTQVQAKSRKLRTSNPQDSGVYVHGKGEEVQFHDLNIQAGDASDDGLALRLAIACGANVGLHHLGEGGQVNYATAKEMGEPTALFYTERQNQLIQFLINLLTSAYRRKCALGLAVMPAGDDLQLQPAVTEIARADNLALAQAAAHIVAALQGLKAEGWVDDTTALKLAFKFAGEALSEDDITRILGQQQEDS